ncbi:DUF6438 domain-containing protein [Botryobacter ruber]|uniref:DUF6438 domain-containing protein n=1 Tax=Botryobacter ruber TaxID=2171629 RepID=UPI000E0AC31A|nr:DUF6438 domain-containing protein [Botryobacter ruber]
MVPEQNLQPQTGGKQLLLLYQKTPCYGTCPAFDAHIYTDGTIIFKAWAHVPFTDTLASKLTPKELERLKRDLNHLPYQGWRTTYLSQRTDQPSTITTFYEAGREAKSVKHQEGGPEDLQLFQKKMDALLLGVISRSTAAKE